MGQAVGKAALRTAWYNVVGSFPLQKGGNHERNDVDAIATARAIVNDLKAGAIVEGGSTITQQLAKNQYFIQEQTVERKIAEVFMALTMEQHFSKHTILELYVNSIYSGDGYEGIGSAIWGYFGKAPARSMPTNARCWPVSRTRRARTRCLRTLASRELQLEVLRRLASYD